MTRPLQRIFLQEDLNFLLTNRIPRQLLTRAVGVVSRIEQPLVRDASLAIWRLFADDLNLAEAEPQQWRSLHDVFVRRLRPEARPIDPRAEVLVSPCDAIVGSHGRVRDGQVFQAKGFPYALRDLLPDPAMANLYHDGWYVTLRLKADMYHRFHAPCDARLDGITYVSGDTWNVNPIALQRVQQLFCKNERVVLPLHDIADGVGLVLVPVAAIAVACMHIHGLPQPLDLQYRGPNQLPLQQVVKKGQELGYFAAGSTILVFARGPVALADGIAEGVRVRMGEPLLRLTTAAAAG